MASANGNEKIPTRTVKSIPRRGQILDANYTPLVTSISFYDIHMDPTVITETVFNEQIEELCSKLSTLFPNSNPKEYELKIRKARKKNSRYVLIKKKATNEERKKLKQFPIFKLGRLKGGLIDNQEIIIRKRPHGELMIRTLGYVRERS